VGNEGTQRDYVLIVCAAPRFLAEIKIELTPYYEVGIAAASTTAHAAMEMHDVAAVLICISENCEDVFVNFNAVYELARSRNVPIIFLAEKGNDNDEIAAFAVGAVDYTARRQSTTIALLNRIRLRISASKHEKLVLISELDPRPASMSPESVLSGKTILVVEDVELNREIIDALLSDINGLTLDFACDGEEAVEKVKAEPERFSLVLMDVYMPVMNGLDATRAIRNLGFSSIRNLPIIALTAATDESEIELCFKSGMDDYIEKPISYDKLLAVITAHFL